MNFTKELYDNLNQRAKHPILGSLTVFSILYNWKALFLLFFSEIEAFERLERIQIELYGNKSSQVMSILVPFIFSLLVFFFYPYLHKYILTVHHYFRKMIENHIISIESRFPVDADTSLALRESNQKLQSDINGLKQKYSNIDSAYKSVLETAFNNFYGTATKIFYSNSEEINVGNIIFVNNNHDDLISLFPANKEFNNSGIRTYLVLFKFQLESENYVIAAKNGVFKLPNFEPNAFYEISSSKPGFLEKKNIAGNIESGKNVTLLKTEENGKIIFQ